VESQGKWFLLDAGPGRFAGANLAEKDQMVVGSDRVFGPEGVDDPVRAAMVEVGLEPTDLAGVVISHLHYDHCGGLELWDGLPVPIHVQTAEWQWATEDPDRASSYGIPMDFLTRLDLAWALEDGPVALAADLIAWPTPGHTPGHQSFEVRLSQRSWLLCADAADLTENLDLEIPPAGPPGSSLTLAKRSLRWLKTRALAEDLLLIPGHDPRIWPELCRSRWD
jgi:N-acyl homoserine lactone hydrolase